MTKKAPGFGIVVWAVLITMLVSAARLTAEVQGWVPPTSGGALNPLGISWLAFLFGGVFAVNLARAGCRPNIKTPWPVTLIVFLAVVASIPWQFGPLFEAPADDATFARLRGAVLTLALVASIGAGICLLVWPRLALTMLLYAIPARLMVFGITWLAKTQGWTTHYTKFGPPGIERNLEETMVGAAIAQGGFWIPFTVVCGTALGAFFSRKR